MTMAWGAKVSPTFRDRVAVLAADQGSDPSCFMACMAFESGETFRANIANAAGSGAVGLIQFMPQTAAQLGTTTEMLAKMTPEDQLIFVAKYFAPFKGRLHNLGDIYMAILWPGAIGKPDDWVMFAAGGAKPKLYLENKGLDVDHDGDVTRYEALTKIRAELARGLLPQNAA